MSWLTPCIRHVPAGQLLISKSRPGGASVPVQGSAPPAWGGSAPGAQPSAQRRAPVTSKRTPPPPPPAMAGEVKAREEERLGALPVKKLKAMCAEYGLPQWGTKQLLSQRIAFREGAAVQQ